MADFNTFIGNISKEQFFEEYWQKKVLVVKNAFTSQKSLAEFQEILSLGLDEDYETRLVSEKDGEYPWQALEGPFDKEVLDLKNGKSFTFIAHNLNLYFSEFYQFQKMLNFFPTWLFDDVMATCSTKGATVGAHVDNYNVFILQGKGKRNWQIQYNPDTSYIDDLDIKLLQNFNPDHEYVLSEGDMIYIPPQVAHNGISLENSLSYSVGFRAFNNKDMVFSYFNHMLEKYESYDYFKMDNLFSSNPDELTNNDFLQATNILNDESLIKEWFAKYTSEPRVESYEPEILKQSLDLSKKYFKNEFTRLTFYSDKENFCLNINSNSFLVNKSDLNLLTQIFKNSPLEALTIDPNKVSKKASEILLELYNLGIIYCQE